MDIPSGASSRAARIKARLNEPRRRLPANATTRCPHVSGMSVSSFPTKYQELSAGDAGLEVLPHGERLHPWQGPDHVILEPERRSLAGPAGWIFHFPLLCSPAITVATKVRRVNAVRDGLLVPA